MRLKSVVQARHDASSDLGITVTAPYQFVDEPSKLGIECIGLVEQFGSKLGVVMVGRHSQPEPILSLAKEHGQYCSFIDEESYSHYRRSLFVATLNDWGWYGDRDRVPIWYTGEPWSDRGS